ncbi:MAG: ATP synthase F1 subunit delta [Clostridiales bacterium]|jgi:F-type H+-transporting ATPase subunit delta|nr:ATP synthase F1 subunit delta [Clostridiales bacterium]
MTNQNTITGLPDENIIAKRYAEALFAIGGEQKIEQEFASQMENISISLMADEGRLTELLGQGRLPLPQQKAIIKEVFAKDIHPLLLNTLYLLLDKGRGGYLPALPLAYQRLLDEKAGILAATVISPRPLEPEQEAGLITAIAQISGKKIRLRREVDESLIGGLKLIIGDTIYDGTLSKQLEKLENSMRN